MKRSILLHECRTSAEGRLLWLVFVLGALVLALALATTAAAGTAYFSFEGAFTDGTETQSFLFSTSAALRPPAPFTLRTWQYDGTLAPPGNAAGYPIAAGGFDSILWLYNDTPALIAQNDDYFPPARDSLIDWNTAGMPEQLATDNYQLDLVAFGGTLGGRDGHWAVDLVSDAAKFTLTGVDEIDGTTGGTSIYSLAMGSDDVRLPATLQLDGGDSLTMSGPLVVGNTGGGVANILGTIESEFGSLGNYTGSDGAISIHTGGSWSAHSLNWPTYVGWWGKGTLLVQTDGTADFTDMVVGTFPGSEGNLVVSGANAVVTVDEVLHVGYDGTGTLIVNEYGLLDSLGGGGGYADTVAQFAGSIGTVDVEGYDSRWLTNELVVGQGGHGTVRITSGGTIDTTGNAYIGRLATASGSSVTVAGMSPAFSKATWAVSGDLHIAGDEAGPSSAPLSRLTINPGGFVDVAGTTTVWNGGGNLDLLGGEMETGSLIVKPGATFTHEDGTLTVDGGTFDPGTGTGNYVITGADSADRPKVVLSNGATGTLNGELFVGQDNYGELLIDDQATLSALSLVSSVAGIAPSSSNVTVTGANSRLVITGDSLTFPNHEPLLVGVSGPSQLNVMAGGQVQVQQGGVWLGCCAIGSPPYFGSGEIVVDGQDSRLEAKHFRWSAAGADSYVRIREKGVVHATDTSYFSHISPESPHTIDVEVSGLNSLLQIDAGLIVSGYGMGGAGPPGTARLNIRNGGRTQVAHDVWIGGLNLGTSSGMTFVELDGGAALAAALQVGGTLYVGGYDQGTGGGAARLTVANNGQVSAGSIKVWQPGTVELNHGVIYTGSLELAGGTLHGWGNVLLPGLGSLHNAGLVSPDFSVRTIAVSGNYVQDAAGTLAIEIGGTSQFEYGRLEIVVGSASLAGTLDVSFIDLGGGMFAPSAGDTFEILTAAGGLGGTTFDNIFFPDLRGGLVYGVFYNPTDVTLAVGGVLGDYNLNGFVDAADYTVWRNTLGQMGTGLAADGDNTGASAGVIDQADYAVWKTHFGQTAGSGASLRSFDPFAGVPEPATWALMAGSGAFGVLASREMGFRRSKRSK